MIKQFSGFRSALVAGLVLAVGLIGVAVPSGTASAAPEPDGNGVYRSLEIAQQNVFRVYAQRPAGAVPGETIHFTIYPGEREGVADNVPQAGLCTYISLQRSDGTVLSNARITGKRHDGSTFSFTGVAARQRTCSTGGANDDLTMQEVTISYTVPTTDAPISSMAQAYRAEFESITRVGAMIQGNEWRIRVNNSTTDPNASAIPGRVWFVGDNSGAHFWQNGGDGSLNTNQTTHSFRYVRDDGYRYAVQYDNYHGIWSDFHGGVYGARLNSGSNVPIYRSYDQDQDDDEFRFKVSSGANLAYVFVDCPWSSDLAMCPATLPIARTQPITSDAAGTVVSNAGNTYTADTTSGNPIADVNGSATATNNYRYTGYAPGTNLAGGRVTVPYTAMQSGTIRLRVTQNGTLLCQRDFLVDDPDGSGIAGANSSGSNAYTWQFQQDPACSSGTLRTAPVATIPIGDTLRITAQAIRLGEMHFIEADTEKRGGIEVRGNGLGTTRADVEGTVSDTRNWVAWYDPFSRLAAHTCADIPPQIGSGPAVTPPSGSQWDSASGIAPFYYQNTDLDGIFDTNPANTIGHLGAQTVTPARGDRSAVNSIGGVHGWATATGCYGSAANGGYSNNDGTASATSTWGNERVIDDWTYAFRNPPARVISIGGPTYTLAPTVDVLPGSTIGVGEQAQFTMSVRNLSSAYLSNDTDWVIRRIVIPAGGTLNTAARNPVDATDFSCGYYTSVGGGVTCDDTDPTFSGTTRFPAGVSTPLGTNNEVGTVIGSRICYALMVNSVTQDPQPNFAEVVTCVTVAKTPHLEARNGDVFAGGQFPSVSLMCAVTDEPIISSSQQQVPIGGPYYTSFATYGVTSLGSSLKFGSQGLSYDSTSPATPSDDLVFANNASVDGFFYSATAVNSIPANLQHCLNDPYTVFGPRAIPDVAGTSIDISSPLVGDTNLTATGTVTLYASAPIPAGKKIVIYAKNASVRIASNIQYADSDGGPGYSDVNRIPQIVILTDHSIVVQENAQAGALSTGGKITQLDGIYAAKENFYTCDVVPRLNTCATPLTVNGAVVVGKNVVPLRTFGAEPPDFGVMAETFNLRLDMFVNQLPGAGSSDVFIKTASEKEAPQRF